MRIHPHLIVTVMFFFLLSSAKFHSPASHVSYCFEPATATAQFGMLNVIPVSFWLTSSKSSIPPIQSTSSFVILLGLLLSGDIELNPGPTPATFNVCTLNIRSFLNPRKYTAIFDLTESRKIDALDLTET